MAKRIAAVPVPERYLKLLIAKQKKTMNETTTIIKNAKSAIDYFDFKTKFSRNQSYHKKNVSYIKKLYDFTNKLFSNKKEIKVIEALILELYTHKLLEWKNQKIALKKVGEIIENPEITKELFKSFIFDNNFFKIMDNGFFDWDDYFEIQEENKDFTNKLTEEILTLFKNMIKWM